MQSVEVIDLFAGMGGISKGFSDEGFRVKGYDINPLSGEIFDINGIGYCETADLSRTVIDDDPDILVGGPPCRPWSSINVTKRKEKHPDYTLLDTYFENVIRLRPRVFLMENVPPLKNDEKYRVWLRKIEESGYNISYSKITYSDFGAATKRSRLFTVGFENGYSADEFFQNLDEYRRPPKTVMEVIEPFLNLNKGEYFDHVWPELKTIHRYEKYYRSGKYGWHILNPDRPAPSFGNVMKTYILHPMAGSKNNGFPVRVISVREAMAIMGFDRNFRFPEGSGMSVRYQMVADAVSPVFSRVCAKVLKKMLK